MTKDEALKLALEALIGDRAFLESDAPVEIWGVNDQAITAIKEALAQSEQEPVAWMCADESLINKGYARFSHVCMGDWKIPVYTTPPQRKPLSEEEIGAILEDVNAYGTRLYTFARAIEAAHGIKGQA